MSAKPPLKGILKKHCKATKQDHNDSLFSFQQFSENENKENQSFSMNVCLPEQKRGGNSKNNIIPIPNSDSQNVQACNLFVDKPNKRKSQGHCSSSRKRPEIVSENARDQNSNMTEKLDKNLETSKNQNEEEEAKHEEVSIDLKFKIVQ